MKLLAVAVLPSPASGYRPLAGMSGSGAKPPAGRVVGRRSPGLPALAAAPLDRRFSADLPGLDTPAVTDGRVARIRLRRTRSTIHASLWLQWRLPSIVLSNRFSDPSPGRNRYASSVRGFVGFFLFPISRETIRDRNDGEYNVVDARATAVDSGATKGGAVVQTYSAISQRRAPPQPRERARSSP